MVTPSTKVYRFVADVMLGKLARWLRVLGVDVAYSNRYSDEDMIRIAATEGRVILTRDAGLVRRKRRPAAFFVSGNTLDEQMRQVLGAFEVTRPQTLSRCMECNTVLQPADREEVFGSVPPYVYFAHDGFSICPDCKRVYWAGTHSENIRKRIASWFNELAP